MNLPAALTRRLKRGAEAPATSPLHTVASLALEALLVGSAWLILPVLPFAASAIAHDWSYLRRYPRTLLRIGSHIAATWRDDAISRAWVLRFDPAVTAEGRRVVGSCTHCGNCCLHKECIFLAFDGNARSFCRIYGGKVWRMLPCGRYPVTQADIDLYDCPSFNTVLEPSAAGPRVIPIRPLFSGERQDREGGS
jgi:hypothetical protein